MASPSIWRCHMAMPKGMKLSDETRQKMSAAHLGKPLSAVHLAALKGRRRGEHAGRPPNTPDVLWSKVDKRGPDECWPWLGFRTPKMGYGRTWIKDRGYYAHRVIFDLANPGVIPLTAPTDRNASGFLIHSCDNPCCCNPAHLRVGTHAENMRDKVERGRCRDFSGDKGPRCKLTMDDARDIRAQRKAGATTRALMELYSMSRASIKTLLRGDSYK